MRDQGNDTVRHCAQRYAESAGLRLTDTPEFTKPTEAKGALIADLFTTMTHDPHDPVVRASYEQFIAEIAAQFHFAVNHLGLHIEAWSGAGEPYPGSRHMMDDIRHHKHLYFLSTRSRWGEADVHHADSPMIATSGVRIDGVELLVNDMFRVVHDIFAHAKEGNRFGAAGEERAWLEHYGMFSPLARPALTAETRGQSCWTFFGPHLRHPSGRLYREGDPEWTPLSERPFAEQKTGLLPAEVSGVRLTCDVNTASVHAEQLPGWDTDSCLGLAGQVRAARPTAPHALTEAYRATTYRATTPQGMIDIRIGFRCHRLDALLREHERGEWAFITAWNPGSRELPLEVNRHRDRELRNRLHELGAIILPGLGIGDDATWTPEESVLALGLGSEAALRLGNEFGQNCVVVGRSGEAAGLLWGADPADG